MLIPTAASVMVFALIHIFIGKLTFLDAVPRSRWLSFSGGVAVAYVFLHILPELARHQETFAGIGVTGQAAESSVFLVSLCGLAVFYGLERAAKTSRTRSDEDRVQGKVLWLHVGSFGIYNLLIGYLLLHREEETGPASLLMYVLAMSLHFLTSDFGLRQDHKVRYDSIARWMLAGAVLLGWAAGIFLELPGTVVGFLFAFLAGGVVLNVLKEELPDERQSRFLPFVLGGAAYGVLVAVA